MLTRRDFLASSLVTTAAGALVPPVFAKSVLAATNDGVHNAHVLVVLQLGGGNDGLNTLIPYNDATYHQRRPTIGVAPDKVLPLDGQLALHPAMPNFKALFDQGRLAVVPGCGYSKFSYSHFEATQIYEYADPQRKAQEGWLGRLLRGQLPADNALTACALGQGSVPGELRNAATPVTAIPSIDQYRVMAPAARQAMVPHLYQQTPGLYGVLYDRSVATLEAGIAAVQNTTYAPAVRYDTQNVVFGSKNNLAATMQLVARMIATEPSVKLVHVVMGGFDTHQAEGPRHAELWSYIDASVSALIKDLEAHSQADRVAVMTWSEFGRRIGENGGQGTDHGSSQPMFLLGHGVKGGIHAAQPSLAKTVDGGNLDMSVDFRSVYQSVIRDWLGGDPAAVLGTGFSDLRLFA